MLMRVKRLGDSIHSSDSFLIHDSCLFELIAKTQSSSYKENLTIFDQIAHNAVDHVAKLKPIMQSRIW